MNRAESESRPAERRWLHVAALAGSQAIRAIGPIITLPIIARVSTPFEFGQFAFFLALGQALSLAIDFGFALSGYALLTGDEEGNRRTFIRVSLLKCLVALVAMAAVVAATVIIAPAESGYAIAASLYAAALGLSPLWLLNYHRRSILMVLFEALPVVAMFVGAVALLFVPVPLPWIIGLAAIAGFVGPLFVALRAEAPRFAGSLADTMPHGFLGQFRLMGARLLAMVYTVAIIPLAAASYSFDEIARYAACEKLASVAGLVGIVAAQNLAPRFATATGGQVATLAKRALLTHALIAAAIVLGLGSVGAALVELLYGPKYAGLDAGAWLLVGAGGLSYITTVVWSGIMVPGGRGRLFATASAAGAIAALVLLYLPFGGNYAWLALARCSAELAVLLVSLVALRAAFARRE